MSDEPDDGKVSPFEVIGQEIQKHGWTLTARDGKMILAGYLVGRNWTEIAAEILLGKDPARLRFQIETMFAKPRTCGDPMNPDMPDVMRCEREPGHERDWHQAGAVKWNRGLVGDPSQP